MKILIVDDVDNRKVLKTMLHMDGHEIYEVENGQKAIDFYNNNELDLILMDASMSNFDGYAATKYIKEKSKDNFTPIIYLTELTDEESLTKCIESGGDDFLFKPYNRVLLREKIKVFDKIRQLYKQNHAREKVLSEYYDRIERDQSTAENIYSNLIEKNETDKRIIDYLYKPADKFNGDLILSQKKPDGGYNLLVGDFTGHGLGTAIGSFPAAEIFIGMTAKGFSTYEIISEINSRLKKLLPINMFLAAVLVDVNTKEQRVSIWNGGLPDMYVFSHEDSNISEVIESTSLPLGVVDSNSLNITETVLKLKTGDSIVVHSDGVIETDNSAGDFFGTERFESLINSSIPKGTFINDVTKAVIEFRGEEIQRDDLTVVQFKFDWELLKTIGKADKISGRYMAASNWEISLELGHDTLKQVNPIPLVLNLITEIQAIESHKSNLFMILTELIVNSLEYGVLGLDSKMNFTTNDISEYYQQRDTLLEELNDGWIKLKIKNKPKDIGGEMIISVSDSGKGFDFNNVMEVNENNSGRGLNRIEKSSTEVNYYADNNLLKVVYEWE